MSAIAGVTPYQLGHPSADADMKTLDIKIRRQCSVFIRRVYGVSNATLLWQLATTLRSLYIKANPQRHGHASVQYALLMGAVC